MEERVAQLSQYILDSKNYGGTALRALLDASERDEAKLEEALTRCEQLEEKLRVKHYIEVLRQKKATYDAICAHPAVAQGENIPKNLSNLLGSIGKTLAEFEFDAETGRLVKGRPIASVVGELDGAPINVKNLKAVFDKFAGVIEVPAQPNLMEPEAVLRFLANAKGSFERLQPLIAASAPAMAHARRFNELAEMARKAANAGEPFDVAEMDAIGAYILGLQPSSTRSKKAGGGGGGGSDSESGSAPLSAKPTKAKAKAKCKGSWCSTTKLAADGYCRKCLPDHCQEQYAELERNLKPLKKKLDAKDKNAYPYFKQRGAWFDLENLADAVEKNANAYAEFKELYDRIQRYVDGEEEYEPSYDADLYNKNGEEVPLHSEASSDVDILDDDEDDEEEDYEEEEDEDEEESGDEDEEGVPDPRRGSGKRPRDDTLLRDVLEYFAPVHKHLRALAVAPNVDESFATLRSTTKRYRVELYNDGELQPWFPEPSVFFSEKEARRRIKELCATGVAGLEGKVVEMEPLKQQETTAVKEEKIKKEKIKEEQD